MKLVLWVSILLATLNTVNAQESPVQWKVVSKKLGKKTFEVHIIESVTSPGHIYSQNTPAGGSLPTKIQFSKNPFIIINGMPKENGELKEKFEKVFNVKVKYFSGNAEFVQLVKLKSEKVKTNLIGNIEYMACTDQQCLPPATFSFTTTLAE